MDEQKPMAGPAFSPPKGGVTGTLPWLAELNAQQREAVTHGDGPLLVVAGAGSGKTKTLACRVAYLIASGVRPERILLLTFTRRAAEEMLKRAAAMMEKAHEITGRVWGGTFHATANRILRIYAQAAGLSPDFTVMDQADAEDLLNMIRHEMGLSEKKMRFPRKGTCLAIYSRCVNGGEQLEPVLKRQFPWCADWHDELKNLFRTYVERKQERAVLDYDDLLLYWQHLVSDETLARDIGGRFDHVLVDEYQDTNAVQAGILTGLRRFCSNIMVVGDDCQSIYGFRAATVRNILDFPDLFPGATIVKLEQNYRSTPPILETTNRVIAQAKERYTKELWSRRDPGQRPKLVLCADEGAQDEFVVQTILRHYEEGIPLRRQAVLFRAGHMSGTLEVELTRRNIPFHKYGGLRFLEAAHIKDLLGYLRIMENARDDMAWFRVLQLCDGVGPTTAAKVIAHVRQAQHNPEAIRDFAGPPGIAPSLTALAALFAELKTFGGKHPAAQVERIRKYYDPLLEKNYDNPTVRRRDLEQLEQIASGYRARQQFLTDLTLDPPSSTSDLAGPPVKDEDWLVLSTIHSAKGCEWDVVILIHAADGFLPSDMSTGDEKEIEEELRLTYVALTRAKDFLYVTYPHRYYHRKYQFGDGHSYAQLCRFLAREDVLATVDQIRVGDVREPSDEASIVRPVQDIRAKLKSQWD